MERDRLQRFEDVGLGRMSLWSKGKGVVYLSVLTDVVMTVSGVACWHCVGTMAEDVCKRRGDPILCLRVGDVQRVLVWIRAE